jgi:hypothetical protein
VSEQKEHDMKKITLLCLILSIAFVSPGHTAEKAAGLKDIPLVWKPSNAISTYGAIDLTAYRNAQFVIKPFTDERKQPAEIGINTEKRFSGQDMLVTTNQNVADWLTDKFSKVFPQFGINVVTGNGIFFVDAAVDKFFVTEGSDYKADVSLKVKLTAKNGVVVWEGTTSGTTTSVGRSARADNYYEALSNAAISAVHGLLNNDSFKQAVMKNK